MTEPASASDSAPAPLGGQGALASPAASSPLPRVEPGRLLYQPPSWFERLDPAVLFPRGGPLEVELGSGDGSFLVAWASRHPDRNYLGVERLLGRARKLDRKAQRGGLTNLLVLRIEAAYCLEYLIPPGAAAAIHVYFPDPWPKRRHHKNRLVNERFPDLAHAALEPGGWVHLRTDSAEYFRQMQSVFAAARGFVEGAVPGELAGERTDFEREFNARGIPTLRASYRREP